MEEGEKEEEEEFEGHSGGGRAFQEKGISMCKVRDWGGHGDMSRAWGMLDNRGVPCWCVELGGGLGESHKLDFDSQAMGSMADILGGMLGC